MRDYGRKELLKPTSVRFDALNIRRMKKKFWIRERKAISGIVIGYFTFHLYSMIYSTEFFTLSNTYTIHGLLKWKFKKSCSYIYIEAYSRSFQRHNFSTHLFTYFSLFLVCIYEILHCAFITLLIQFFSPQ